jgi:hypothetical protein
MVGALSSNYGAMIGASFMVNDNDAIYRNIFIYMQPFHIPMRYYI